MSIVFHLKREKWSLAKRMRGLAATDLNEEDLLQC